MTYTAGDNLLQQTEKLLLDTKEKQLINLSSVFFLYSSCEHTLCLAQLSSLGRYVFGSEISYNKAPPRLPGLGC